MSDHGDLLASCEEETLECAGRKEFHIQGHDK